MSGQGGGSVPSSGALKLSDIAALFNRSYPIRFSQLYRGGAAIANIAANAAVPSVGMPLPLSTLRGATKGTLLDALSFDGSSPSAIYALRLMLTSYAGPMVRVRHSASPAEADVYYDSEGNVQSLNIFNSSSDMSVRATLIGAQALATFLGPGAHTHAFVTKWYDQSGGDRHFVQTQSQYQPLLSHNQLVFYNQYMQCPGQSLAATDMTIFVGTVPRFYRGSTTSTAWYAQEPLLSGDQSAEATGTVTALTTICTLGTPSSGGTFGATTAFTWSSVTKVGNGVANLDVNTTTGIIKWTGTYATRLMVSATALATTRAGSDTTLPWYLEFVAAGLASSQSYAGLASSAEFVVAAGDSFVVRVGVSVGMYANTWTISERPYVPSRPSNLDDFGLTNSATADFGLGTGPDDGPATAGATWGANQYALMAASRQGSTGDVNIYRNGLPIASGTRASTGSKGGPATQGIALGGTAFHSARLSSRVNMLVSYPSALTPANVQDFIKATKWSPYAAPVAGMLPTGRGLFLCLDAQQHTSTASIWADQSGAGNDFTVSPLAYATSDSGVAYFDFSSATTGMAKRSAGLSVPAGMVTAATIAANHATVTLVMIAQPNASSTNARTLLASSTLGDGATTSMVSTAAGRSTWGVLDVSSGGGASTFVDSALPLATSGWNMLTVKLRGSLSSMGLPLTGGTSTGAGMVPHKSAWSATLNCQQQPAAACGPVLLEYPPSAMTAATSTLGGSRCYTTGTYTASASSQLAGTTQYPHKAFDKLRTTTFSWAQGMYSWTTGLSVASSTSGNTIYSTSSAGQVITATAYGEWLQLQLPEVVMATSYVVTLPDAATVAPADMLLLASLNGGLSWVQVDAESDVAYSGSGIKTRTFAVGSPVPASTYRLVVTRVALAANSNVTSNAALVLTLAELSLGTDAPEYPPIALTSDTPYAVWGLPYGNGTYALSASSAANMRCLAFDRFSTTYFESAAARYSGGAATGSAALTTYTDAAGQSASVRGEWLQVQLPSAATIRGYYILHRAGYNPVDFVLLGSADNGTSWSLLDSRSSLTTWTAAAGQSFAAAFAPLAPTHVRLVVSRVNASVAVMDIAELSIFASPAATPALSFASLASAEAQGKPDIASIGGHHGSDFASALTGSAFFGKVAVVLGFASDLTPDELLHIYALFQGRFALPSYLPAGGRACYSGAANSLTLLLDSFAYMNAGATWSDLSGCGQDFMVTSSDVAFNNNYATGVFSMGTTSASVTTSVSILRSIPVDVPLGPQSTFILFTVVRPTYLDWRTLLRGYYGDHPVIIQQATNTIGLYDSDTGNFLTSGVDMSATQPNFTSSYNMYTFRFSTTTAPYWQMTINTSPTNVGTISDVRASINNGFYMLASLWSSNIGSQLWGRVGSCMLFNRHLSYDEVLDVYARNYLRYPGLAHPLTQFVTTVTDGLVLFLEASQLYSRNAGSTWRDFSGCNNDFTVNPAAWTVPTDGSSPSAYMNFSAATGIATCARSGGVTVPNAGNMTLVVVGTPTQQNASSRVLIGNGITGDAQACTQAGADSLGCFSATLGLSGAFASAVPDITGLANQPTSNLNMYVLRYYSDGGGAKVSLRVNYNDSTLVYTTNSTAALLSSGFDCIGGLYSSSASSSSSSSSSSYFGRVAMIAAYNRTLSDSEVATLFDNLYGRYGIVSATGPPIMSGLVGYYTGESFVSSPSQQWRDLSGQGNHTVLTKGTISNSSTFANGRKYLTGATTAGLRFPVGILPTTYTLLALTKYNGSNRLRILSGVDTNWLSGHWSGKSGVFYHDAGWWSQSSVDVHGNDWVILADNNNIMRSNMVDRKTATGGMSTGQLCINYSNISTNEVSDWAAACILVYNRQLSLAEVTQLEAFLYTSYLAPGILPQIDLDASAAVAAAGDGIVTSWPNAGAAAGTATVYNNPTLVAYASSMTRKYVRFARATSQYAMAPTFSIDAFAGITVLVVAAINATTGTLGYERVFDFGIDNTAGNNSNIGFNRLGVTNNLQAFFFNGSTAYFVNTTLAPLADTQFHAYAVVFGATSTGTRMRILQDSSATTLADATPASSVMTARTLSVNRIARPPATEAYLDGSIAYFQWCPYVLPDPIIKGRLAQLCGRYGLTVASYTPVASGLVMGLDAYCHSIGSSTWTDFTGNGYDFEVNSSAYKNPAVGPPSFDFGGSYGIAKCLAASGVPAFAAATLIVVATMATGGSPTGNKTLVASSVTGDKQVLVSGNYIASYKAATDAYATSAVGLTTIKPAGPATGPAMYAFRLSSSSTPYLEFLLNGSTSIAQLSAAAAKFETGFNCIGGIGPSTAQGNPLNAAETFGTVYSALYYNRSLSAAELKQIYTFQAARFGMITVVPPMDGLVLHLDASHSLGSFATTWRDLSGSGYDFDISSQLYNRAAGISYMNFDASVGVLAKRSLGPVPAYPAATLMAIAMLNPSSTSARTLVQGFTPDAGPTDSQVTIKAGTLQFGVTDADSGGSSSVPALDAMTSTASMACRGAFALRRLASAYTGPTLQLRRSSDNATQDFYANYTGALGTLVDAGGTSYATWLGTSTTAYVTTWYDQSGKGNHATQTTEANQPILQLAKGLIDFTAAARWFNLPNATVPTGSSAYTVVAKHGVINQATIGTWLSSGSSVANQSCSFSRSSATYNFFWWGNDFTTGTYAVGNTVSVTYNGASSNVAYVNGVQVGTSTRTGRNSLATTNYIGYTPSYGAWYGELYHLFIFDTDIGTSDRTLAEAATPITGFVASSAPDLLTASSADLLNPTTQYNMYFFRLAQASAPYWQLYANSAVGTPLGQIVDPMATFNNGIAVIGGATTSLSSVTASNSAYFGRVSLLSYYNRAMGPEDMMDAYMRYYAAYSLAPPLSAWLGSSLAADSTLQLFLEASLCSSGSTLWRDWSGMGNDFRISSTACVSTASPPYMLFSAATGVAKKVTGVIANGGIQSIVCVTTVQAANAAIRALVTSSAATSQASSLAALVAFPDGSNALGMIPTGSTSTSTSFQTAIPDMTALNLSFTTRPIMLTFLLQVSGAPYYSIIINDDIGTTYTIQASSAALAAAFDVIGGFDAGDMYAPMTASNHWGSIYMFAAFSKLLSTMEVTAVYVANASRYNLQSFNLPPVTTSLVGLFTGDSWSSTLNRWTDLSGANNHATTIKGSISTGTLSNGRKFIQGGTTAGLQFNSNYPAAATATLIAVARYTPGGARGRIFDAIGTNWLACFHNTKSGVAYHSTWLTPQIDIHGNDWIVFSDQYSLFRSQFVTRSSGVSSVGAYTGMAINNGSFSSGELSDWSVACVALYNRQLSLSEIQQVETFFYSRYMDLPPIIEMDASKVSGITVNSALTTWSNTGSLGGSGTGVNGPVLRSSALLSGSTMYAVQFASASSQALSLPTFTMPQTVGFSVFWVARFASQAANMMLFNYGAGTAYNNTIQVYVPATLGTLAFALYNSTAGYSTSTGTSTANSNDTVYVYGLHVSTITANSRVRFYRNTSAAALVDTTSLGGTVNARTNTVSYLARNQNAANYFDGQLTLFQHYDSAMPDSIFFQKLHDLSAAYGTMVPSLTPVSSGLVLGLDASFYLSGSSAWQDFSSGGRHFAISTTAYAKPASVAYMDFNNNTKGIAKRLQAVPLTSIATIVLVAQFASPSGSLSRPLVSLSTDGTELITVSAGTDAIGMYSPASGGGGGGTFISSGATLAGLSASATSAFNMVTFILRSASPQMTVYKDNQSMSIGTIDGDSRAALASGFNVLAGADSGNLSNPLAVAKIGGRLGLCLVYNRALTTAEIASIFNACKSRFGLTQGYETYVSDALVNLDAETLTVTLALADGSDVTSWPNKGTAGAAADATSYRDVTAGRKPLVSLDAADSMPSVSFSDAEQAYFVLPSISLNSTSTVGVLVMAVVKVQQPPDAATAEALVSFMASSGAELVNITRTPTPGTNTLTTEFRNASTASASAATGDTAMLQVLHPGGVSAWHVYAAYHYVSAANTVSSLLFVDGALAKTSTNSSMTITAQTALQNYIGRSSAYTSCFNGYLRQFLVWPNATATTLASIPNISSSLMSRWGIYTPSLYSWSSSATSANVSGPAAAASGSGIDYQLALATSASPSATPQHNVVYWSRRIQDLNSFTITFDFQIASSASGTRSDFYLFVGSTSPTTAAEPTSAAAFVLKFNAATDSTAIQLQLPGALDRAYITTTSHIAGTWQTVTLTYRSAIHATWEMLWSPTSGAQQPQARTLSDASQASWAAAAGLYWGFGAATASGSSLTAYVRRVQFVANSVTAMVPGKIYGPLHLNLYSNASMASTIKRVDQATPDPAAAYTALDSRFASYTDSTLWSITPFGYATALIESYDMYWDFEIRERGYYYLQVNNCSPSGGHDSMWIGWTTVNWAGLNNVGLTQTSASAFTWTKTSLIYLSPGKTRMTIRLREPALIAALQLVYVAQDIWKPWYTLGCEVALNADAGITTPTANRVSAWADQSGNGRNATQASGAQYPGYVGNNQHLRPAVTFATSGYMLSVSSGLNVTQFTLGIAAYASMKTTAPSTLLATREPSDAITVAALEISHATNTRTYSISLAGTSIFTSVLTAFADGSPYVLVITGALSGSTATLNLYINGTASATETLTGVTFTSFAFKNIHLGGSPGDVAYNYNGGICAASLHSSVLATGDRQELEGYLAHSSRPYGSNLLIANHPYKSVAPPVPAMATSGLKLWLDASSRASFNTSNTTRLNDLSGSGNAFTFTASTGFALDAASGGQFLTLSSSTLRADGPASTAFGIDTEHTLEMLVRPASSTSATSAAQLINLVGTSSERMLMVQLPTSSSLTYDVRYAGTVATQNRLTYTLPSPTAPKHYVVRTRGGTTTPFMEVFMNGISVANSSTATLTTSYGAWGGASYLFNNAANSASWQGDFYFMRLYNRALSDDEVFQNFIASRAKYAATALPLAVPVSTFYLLLVNSSASALTNWVINIAVPYQSDFAANFQDLRFVDSMGNQLNYYIESYTASLSASVWLLLPTLPAGSSRVSITYANAASAGNPKSVFPVYEDFTAITSLDAAVWESGGPSVTLSGGALKLSGADGEVFSYVRTKLNQSQIATSTSAGTTYLGQDVVVEASIMAISSQAIPELAIRTPTDNTAYGIKGRFDTRATSGKAGAILDKPFGANGVLNAGTSPAFAVNLAQKVSFSGVGDAFTAKVSDVQRGSYTSSAVAYNSDGTLGVLNHYGAGTAVYWLRAYRATSAAITSTALSTSTVRYNNLILYLDAGNATSYGGGSGTVTWTDLSGSGNHVTMYNASPATRSMLFNGSSTYGFRASGINNLVSSTLTVVVWVYLQAKYTSFISHLARGTAGSSNQFSHRLSGFVDYATSAYGFNATMTGAPSSDGWYMLAFTKNGLDGKLYKNGTLTNTVTAGAGGDIQYTNRDFAIGFDNLNKTNFASYLSGYLSQVLMYNVALSDAEIAAMYSNWSGSYPSTLYPLGFVTSGLKLYLDFSNSVSYSGSSTTITDLSGMVNNFTLNGTGYALMPSPGLLRVTASTVYAAGPASNLFSITSDHTFEVLCQPLNGSLNLIELLGTSSERMLVTHLPWGNSIFYDTRWNAANTVANRLQYSTTTPVNLKHYVFRTRTSTTPYMEVFENGTSVANSGATAFNVNGTWGGTSRLFGFANVSGYGWLGDLYFVRLYNRALTNAEITLNYTAAKNKYGVIVGNHPMMWFRVEDLSSIAAGGTVSSWPSVVNGAAATGGSAGTATLPILNRDEAYPYVRLGTGSVSSANGSFFTCGSKMLNMSTNGGFTCAAVFRFRGPAATYERLFDFGNGAGVDNVIVCRNITTTAVLASHRNGSTVELQTNVATITGGWQAIVFRFQAGQEAAYETALTAVSGTVTLSNRTMANTYIGKSAWAGDTYANLDLRELMFFDKNLSDADMATTRAYLAGKYGMV
jgi:Concanavalin A-like lectin/glucanases superfamily/Domain of unknown function (DUF2341)